MSDNPSALPSFVKSANFPFEGQLRVKRLDPPVDSEPARDGEDPATCATCGTADDAYIWVSDRWRVRAMDRPGGLPMVLILESRSHLDIGDLPNLLAAELGVMTVRLERSIRSLDGVASVHVNRWADGPAHLHLWFLARPVGRLQLRGTFLSMWDDILERVDEARWREDLAMVAAWLGEFGGRVLAEPPRIEWHAPSSFSERAPEVVAETPADTPTDHVATADSPEATHVPAIPTQRPPTADTITPQPIAVPAAQSALDTQPGPTPAAPYLPAHPGGPAAATQPGPAPTAPYIPVQAGAPATVTQPGAAHQAAVRAGVIQQAAGQPGVAQPTGQLVADHPGTAFEYLQPATPSTTGAAYPAAAAGQAPAPGPTAGTPAAAPQPAAPGRQPAGGEDSLAFLTELSGGDDNYDFAGDARAPAV